VARTGEEKRPLPLYNEAMSRLPLGLAIALSTAAVVAAGGQAAAPKSPLTPLTVVLISRSHGYQLIREGGHVWLGTRTTKDIASYRAPAPSGGSLFSNPGTLLEVIIWANSDLAQRAAVWKSNGPSSEKGTAVRNVTLVYGPTSGGRIPGKVAQLKSALANWQGS
jgi:hypothetical protein